LVVPDELLAAIKDMIKKAEDPKIKKHFENFSKTLLMSFVDLDTDVSISFSNGRGIVESGTIDNPNLLIRTDSRTIIDIFNGNLSAVRAFMSGKIKADGPTRDLMKLQHLLKA
jgi:putative sterol carrier protein